MILFADLCIADRAMARHANGATVQKRTKLVRQEVDLAQDDQPVMAKQYKYIDQKNQINITIVYQTFSIYKFYKLIK